MWYVCDVLYVCVCYFVVCGCAVSRRYIDVCYCDMFSVFNVYLDNSKYCVVCINGRRYVCCAECYVVSNECDEPTSCLVQPVVAHCCEVILFYSSVQLWDLTAGKLLNNFRHHDGPVTTAEFHPSEFLLTSGSADK